MNDLVTTALANTFVVALALVAVVLARRFSARPQLIHAACVLMLLKLVTPPILTPDIKVLPGEPQPPTTAQQEVQNTAPSVVSQPAFETATVVETTPGRTIPPVADAQQAVATAPDVPLATMTRSKPTWSVDGLRIAMLIWVVGSMLWLLVSVRRIVRFRRWIRDCCAADSEVISAAQHLANRLGLHPEKIPSVRFVDGNASPMLWSLFGRARIILPHDLWQTLDAPQRQSLLLHELAHFRRRDHWVRLLEFVVTGIYWWNPILWLVRRELRQSEEECCDQIVVGTLPESKRAYAEAIVKTIGQISVPAVPGGTGIGWLAEIENRLSKIMQQANHRPLSRALQSALVVFGCLFLSWTPMLAPAPAQDAVEVESSQPAGKVLVSVVDPDGRPLDGVEISAIVESELWTEKFTTDLQGKIRVPATWLPKAPGGAKRVVLGTDDAAAGFGWLDLERLSDDRSPKADGKDGPVLTLRKKDHRFVGRFVDKQGRPLAGVRAKVVSIAASDNGNVRAWVLGEATTLGEGVSDGGGRFWFDLPKSTQFAIRVEHRDWIARQLYGRGEQMPLGDIELSPAGRIEGRLVGADGGPLAGHRVGAQAWNSQTLSEPSASWGTATSDQDGRYVIGGLPAGRFNVLYVSRSDKRELNAPAVEGVHVKVGAATEANFQVEKGTRVFGKVVDAENGKPLSGIHVGHYGSARPESGAAALMQQTKEDGSFAFFVPEGLSLFYVAEGERQHVPDGKRVMKVAGEAVGPLTLKAGPKTGGVGESVATVNESSDAVTYHPPPRETYKVKIQLQPPAGKSVNHVLVRTVSVRSQRTNMWSVKSGEEIEMEFNNPSPGPFFFSIDATGYLSARSEPISTSDKNPVVTIPLTPEKFVPIRGRVVDRQGTPIAGARVRLRRDIFQEMQFPFGVEYQSDQEGNFLVDHIRVGDRVQVRLDKEGTGGADSPWLDVVDGPAVELAELVLGPPDKKLGGRVRNYNGIPLAGAKVSLSGYPDIHDVTDDSGEFLLQKVPNGRQAVMIAYKQLRPKRRNVMAGRLDHDLRIQSQTPRQRDVSTVDIKLVTGDGEAVQWARYFGCFEGGDYLVGMPDRRGNFEQWDFTDQRERFPNKKLVVCVWAKDYRFAVSEPFAMRDNPPPVTIELEPSPPATVTGMVIDQDGNPLEGVRVGASLQLTENDNFEDWNYYQSKVKLPTTGADGRFSIPNQPVGGRLAVYVKKVGFAGQWSERIELTSPGENEVPTIQLSTATLQVGGQVRDSLGKFVGGAVVEILDLGVERTTTDAKGRFLFDGLGQRNFHIQVASREGDWWGQVTSGNTNLEINLNPKP